MDGAILRGGDGIAGVGLRSGRLRSDTILELRRNYAEVLELVRKFDAHLDRTEQRSERLMAILERIPEAAEAAPALREQQAQTLLAIERLAKSGESQSQAIVTLGDQVREVGRVGSDLTASVVEFRGALGEMTEAENRVGDTLGEIHRAGEAREEELIRLMAANRRTTIVAMCVCTIGAMAAIGVAVVALAL